MRKNMKIFPFVFLLLSSGIVSAEQPCTSDFQYQYKARIIEVYDGDTVTADIDLGFGIVKTGGKLRLYGINAPEMREPEKKEGTISRDKLREWILGKDVIVKTIKDKKGKFGRYLAIIFIGGVDVNERLVAEGLAVEKEY